MNQYGGSTRCKSSFSTAHALKTFYCRGALGIRVNPDTVEIFESGKKTLRIQKYPDMCGRGLSFDWEDSVWSHFQTLRSSSKILRFASYFQLSSRCLKMWSFAIFLVWYIYSNCLTFATSKLCQSMYWFVFQFLCPALSWHLYVNLGQFKLQVAVKDN